MHSKLSATATLDQTSWDRLDQLIDQVESQWRQGLPANLAQLNLPESGTLRERALVELIKVDQDFRFRAGEPRRLEEYFREWPELAANPAVASELLSAECLTQSEHGTIPTRAELRARFPELFDVMELPATEIWMAHSADARGRGLLADTNLVGHPFGRYEIRALLGHGGMGMVYRAMDRQLGREVALKVPHADLVDDPVVLERFLREARAAAGVRHPHVCPIYDVGEFEGTYFLSMALVEGESLAAVLQRGPLPPERATELVRKLASALARVHQAGVVHRDIKPANVMIDESGEPLLMDFGLARLAESHAHETRIEESAVTQPSSKNPQLSGSAMLGTPAYMSPEQAGGDPQAVDTRTDLYSLGVVLYQSLTGELPCYGAPSNTPSPLRIVLILDPMLAAVVSKAMAHRLDERFQTASEFVAALESWQASHRAARPFGSRTAILSASLVVVLLVGAIYVLSNKQPVQVGGRSGDSTTRSPQTGGTPLTIGKGVPPKLAKAPFSPEQAAAAQQAWADRLGVDVEITNSIGMTLRLIPPGEFTMGSSTEEIEALLKTTPEWNQRNINSEGPTRDVVIDQAFYLGTCEVTVGQFRAFVTESNYQTWAERPGNAGRVYDVSSKNIVRRAGFFWNNKFVAQAEDHPVVLIHHEDAEAFCEWLGRKENGVYGLPTEEQWEFACRAGSVTPWYWGTEESETSRFAWFMEPRTASQAMPVGRKLPNAFGLFDMSGNVSEMTIGPRDAILLRSGNSGNNPSFLRSAAREIANHNDPTHRNGFRVLKKLARTEPR